MQKRPRGRFWLSRNPAQPRPSRRCARGGLLGLRAISLGRAGRRLSRGLRALVNFVDRARVGVPKCFRGQAAVERAIQQPRPRKAAVRRGGF